MLKGIFRAAAWRSSQLLRTRRIVAASSGVYSIGVTAGLPSTAPGGPWLAAAADWSAFLTAEILLIGRYCADSSFRPSAAVRRATQVRLSAVAAAGQTSADSGHAARARLRARW